MRIRIFTSFYEEECPQRRNEILECLTRNLDLPEVDQVCLLLENTTAPFEHPKLQTRMIEIRPRYVDFFDWAREFSLGDDDITIVCNSDIYFDRSVKTIGTLLSSEQCVALCRWNIRPNGSAKLRCRNDSQDSWFFRGEIRDVVSDFCVGVARCDNRILYELRQAGYDVINPALSVRTYHLHAGEGDDYNYDAPHFVAPPYHYLWPHNLKSVWGTLAHNIRHRNERLGWRIDWVKFGQTLPVRAVRKLGRMFRRSKLEGDADG